MYDGRNTRVSEEVVASAAEIFPKADLVKLSGSTAISTIQPPFAGFSGILILVPTASTIGLLTTGNISIAVTMAVGRATLLAYSKENNVWYPGAIS